jgi:FkbM family methyltransferase
VSDVQGELAFYIQSGDVSWNSTIVREFAEGADFRRQISVKTTTIDKYVVEAGIKPRVIKTDVEGPSSSFFRGRRVPFASSSPC